MTLHKPQRRQQELRQAKDLMSRTTSLHARYPSWYISYPSSVKQRGKVTKILKSREREPQRQIVDVSSLNLTSCLQFS